MARKIENSEFLKIMRESFEERTVASREVREKMTELDIAPTDWATIDTFKAGRGKWCFANTAAIQSVDTPVAPSTTKATAEVLDVAGDHARFLPRLRGGVAAEHGGRLLGHDLRDGGNQYPSLCHGSDPGAGLRPLSRSCADRRSRSALWHDAGPADPADHHAGSAADRHHLAPDAGEHDRGDPLQLHPHRARQGSEPVRGDHTSRPARRDPAAGELSGSGDRCAADRLHRHRTGLLPAGRRATVRLRRAAARRARGRGRGAPPRSARAPRGP